MRNREIIERRARLACNVLLRDTRGRFLREGYPHWLHDWMQRNELGR